MSSEDYRSLPFPFYEIIITLAGGTLFLLITNSAFITVFGGITSHISIFSKDAPIDFDNSIGQFVIVFVYASVLILRAI
jgi:hypothetical protein